MEHLTGINIRSGMDLNVPLKDIFKTSLEPSGDHRIKEMYYDGGKHSLKRYPLIDKEIIKHGFITFADYKTDTLTAYAFDSYIAYKHAMDNKIVVDKFTDIEFVCSELMSLDKYCFNVMTAQAFSGKYKSTQFLYHFIGIVNFGLEDYLAIHPMIINSNMNMVHLYMYYRNVLVSVDNLFAGQYEKDVRDQKKFLSEKEYRSLIRQVRKQKRFLKEEFEREHLSFLEGLNDDEFGDLDHPGLDYDDDGGDED